MSSWVGKFHKFTKKYDPLGHELVNGAWKSSTKIVNESSRAMESTGEKWGWNTDVPEYGKNLSQKDKGSFNRWGENTLGGVAAVFGGMSAYGAAAGSGSGATAGGGAAAGGGGAAAGGGGAAAGNGAFLGEGVASGVPAWDGAAHGMGLGFNPDAGLSTVNGDFAGTQGSGSNWNFANAQGGGQKKADEPLEESDVEVDRADYAGDPYAYSSKKLKKAPSARMSDVMKRGASGADPIDQNGVHMAAIQALTKKAALAASLVKQLKGNHP